MRVLGLVWERALTPPHQALMRPMVMRIEGALEWVEEARIDRGASFCHVRNKVIVDHGIGLVIEMNQKCRGTSPIFSSSPKISRGARLVLDKRINMDPKAWIIKYFTEISIDRDFLSFIKMGIKDIKLSSNPVHIINQLVADRVRMVPLKVEIKKKVEEVGI